MRIREKYLNNILFISWKKLNSKTDILFRSKGGDFAAKINEEVLVGLIKRGYEIEENDSQIGLSYLSQKKTLKEERSSLRLSETRNIINQFLLAGSER